MLLISDVLKLERPLIGVDLETTSTEPDTTRIVQLALEIYVPGRPVKEYKTLINPEGPIPPGATKVHNITDAMVASAPTFKQLAPNLLKGLTDCDFAGYNVRFDLKVLSAELRRAGATWDYEGACVIDGFRLWQIIEGRSLTHAVEKWLRPDLTGQEELDELGQDNAHDALWDIRMSTRVIAAELSKHSHLPRNLRDLHELCSPGWYDAEGKLQWRDGELCFSFGEHRNKPLRVVPKGYFKWVTGKNFSEKVKAVCHDAIKGIYPQAPPATAASASEE